MKKTHTNKKIWLVAVLAMMLALLFVLASFAESGEMMPTEEASLGLIAYQVTEDEGGSFTLRLITGVSSLDYKNFGYRVRVTTKNENGNNVTTTLTGRGNQVYSSFFSGETEYAVSEVSSYPYAFFTTITGLSTESDYINLEIRPSVTDEDFVTTYGEIGNLLYTGAIDDEGYPALAYTPEVEETEFRTVLRFVATSDMHIKSATSTQGGRLETIMAQLNEYFANEEVNGGHAGVDALAVAGDVTNQIEPDEPTMTFEELAKGELAAAKAYFENLLAGTDTQLVITMGNHDWNAFNKPSEYDNTVAVKLFEEYFGEGSTTGMVKIDGYYFITLNNDDISALPNQAFRGWGWGYSDERVAEYEAMIEAAIADTGTDKPIFVIRHTGDVGTVLGTDEFIAGKSATSVKNLEALQSKYPNLVVLSGHSHYPIYDEFSIHQEHYTSLNTGTLGSSSQSRINGEKVNMTSSSAVTGVWVIEVDELGRTRIRIWDGATNGFYGETYMIESYQKDEFLYTEDRYSNDDIFFADGAKVTVYDAFDTAASIAFLPVSEESLMARAYEIVLSDAEGNVLSTEYILPEYYVQKRDVPMLHSFADLTPATTYNVTVTAITPGYSVEIDHEDAFRSAPLTATFTTAADGVAAGADLIDIVIYPELGTVGRKSAQNLPVGIFGSPEYAYDETINMNVVSLDGAAKNYLRFECKSLSETLVDGFTLETVVRLDEAPTADAGIVSGTQSGGYGIWAYANGKMTFNICDNTTTHKIQLGNYVVGTYYHIVASFDGSVCTVYLNGEAVGSATLDENGLKLPATEKYRNLAVGADVYTGTGVHYPSKCTVGVVRMYSDALTEATVKSNYEALNLPEDEEPEVPETPDTPDTPTPSASELLSLKIDATGKTVTDTAAQGVVLTPKGAGSFVYAKDEEIGMDVISFNANGESVLHMACNEISDELLNGFTFETLVRVDELPTGDSAVGLVGGMHLGGYGLFAYPDGKLEFQIYEGLVDENDTGKTIRKISTTYTVGVYYHVAAVLEGRVCTLYVNGAAVGSYTLKADFSLPDDTAKRNLVAGADSYNQSSYTGTAKCTIGLLTLHKDPMSAEDVAAAYEAATANAPKYLLNLKIDATSQSAVDVAGKGAVQTTLGTPAFAYDETLGRDVVSVDGTSGTIYHFTMQPFADKLLDGGFTLETLVRVDEAPTEKDGGLIGALHGGGFGLMAKTNGTLQFRIYNGTSIKDIDLMTYVCDTYYHVVAVYNGQTCTVYLNGEVAGSTEMSNFVLSASSNTYRNLVVGGDTNIATPSKFSHPSKCTVGILRIYDNALTEAEVTAAYGAAIQK